ncbi:hypothetical protein HQ489_03495 [Candidatus Woesearchaeota archaeon]|nr:hypothetical protein [Candidatus Woesearchaeota archaeon]
MGIVVGSGYWKKRESLVERVITGTIETHQIKSTDYACYFCGDHVEGKTYLLIDENEKSVARYPLDESCYKNIALKVN